MSSRATLGPKKSSEAKGVEPLAYTPKQAAHALQVSVPTIYRLMADHTIQSIKVGGSRRIRRAVIETLLIAS